jgi:DNA-directed RNA polymerase subunit M/transcription elongation factor TFIIS
MTSKRINEIRLNNLLNFKFEKSLQTILGEYCPQLNEEQIKTLMSLKNTEGEDINIMNDRDFIYEMIGLINDIGYNKVLALVKNNQSHMNDKLFFDLDIYNEEREKYYDDIKKLREKIQLTNGKRCTKCGNKNTLTNERQMRSGDEGATVINFCVDCQIQF